MKKSSHKGYCQDRAKANPTKGAKAKALSWFEESTGLCKPCVQKREHGRTSQKCYCGTDTFLREAFGGVSRVSRPRSAFYLSAPLYSCKVL